MLLAIGRYNAAAAAAERHLLLLLPLKGCCCSMDWVVELGHSPAPPAAARGSRQRPLRVGPYSRALITATAPPPSNSPAANVPGGGGEWPGLGLGSCIRSCRCPCCRCSYCCCYSFEAIGCICQRQSGCCIRCYYCC